MLPKSKRIPSSKVFSVLRNGTRHISGPIELRMVKTAGETFRFAVIAGLSVDKRATKRNRMRRLVSESVRHLMPLLPNGYDAVVRIRSKIPDSQAETESLVSGIFIRAGLLSPHHDDT